MADNEEFFPARPETRPMIYAYEEDNPKYAGMLKVGFASTGVEKRVAEQFPVLKPGDKKPYRIVFSESAMYSDGGSFTDKRIHEKLMANEKAMEALMNIEGFRALNKDIETIINKSEHVKKAKRDGEPLTKKEKAELTAEEKEFKSKRKEIQEKLIKFATRIPIFMYLSDYREYSLDDVITKLEPNLFRKVTGLSVKDFNLLCSLNVFNASLMNDAVYKFKRYEDASLVYTGLESKHEGEGVGLFNTVLTADEYKTLHRLQQESL